MGWVNDRWPHFNGRAGTLYRVLRLYASNRSAKAWGRLLRRAVRGPGNPPGPPLFAVGLTYRCVCRCEHCYAGGRVRNAADELTTDEAKRLLDQATEMGALEALFTGGESLLRPDVPELVAHGRSLGLLTRISTNGYLLDERRVEALAEAGLTQAGISLDFADPHEHDRARGLPGLHERAVAGIRRLVEAGIRVQAHCVTFRRSIPDGVQRVIALASDLGVSWVLLIFPAAAGTLECTPAEILTDEERAAVRSLQDFSRVFAELATPQTLCPVSAGAFAYVNPYGDVAPCTIIGHTMGNVRRTPLKEIWRRFREHMDMECRGHCMANDPALDAALEDYVAGLKAMDAESPRVAGSCDARLPKPSREPADA